MADFGLPTAGNAMDFSRIRAYMTGGSIRDRQSTRTFRQLLIRSCCSPPGIYGRSETEGLSREPPFRRFSFANPLLRKRTLGLELGSERCRRSSGQRDRLHDSSSVAPLVLSLVTTKVSTARRCSVFVCPSPSRMASRRDMMWVV